MARLSEGVSGPVILIEARPRLLQLPQHYCWEVSEAPSLAEAPAAAEASQALRFKPIPQQNAECPPFGPVGVTFREESKYDF